MTDEQMKALVHYARYDGANFEYGELLEKFCENQELLIQLCFNVNIELNKHYDHTLYAATHRYRTAVLKEIDEWLKGDQKTRESINDGLYERTNKASGNYFGAGDDPSTIKSKLGSYLWYSAYWAGCAVSYTGGTFGTNSGLFNNGKILDCTKGFFDNARFVIRDMEPVVIKTILDYYGEDFETFEALYL